MSPGIRVITVLVFLLRAVTAAAQQPEHRLVIPTAAVSAAAAADLATTFYGLRYADVRETSPLLRRWQNSRGKLVSMGALLDVASITAWDVAMAREHPRVAISGLWVMTAFRSYLAIHNLQIARRGTLTQ
jgi:hypothetical protein